MHPGRTKKRPFSKTSCTILQKVLHDSAKRSAESNPISEHDFNQLFHACLCIFTKIPASFSVPFVHTFSARSCTTFCTILHKTVQKSTKFLYSFCKNGTGTHDSAQSSARFCTKFCTNLHKVLHDSAQLSAESDLIYQHDFNPFSDAYLCIFTKIPVSFSVRFLHIVCARFCTTSCTILHNFMHDRAQLHARFCKISVHILQKRHRNVRSCKKFCTFLHSHP